MAKKSGDTKETISTTNWEALCHVLEVMEIAEDTTLFLKTKGISSVRRLVATTNVTYQNMLNMADSSLSGADVDQINIFREWHSAMYTKMKGQLTNDELIQCFTEQEWDHFCMRHISQKITQIPQRLSMQAAATISHEPKLKIGLKDYPTTSGQAADWSHYKRNLISIATANKHEHIYDQDYSPPDPTNDPNEYAQYKALNEIAFSALDFGLCNSIIKHKVDAYRKTRDGRAAFLDIDAYQTGQGSEEQCASNAWEELMKLHLTPNTPGGVERFLSQWDETISKLRDIKQAPTPFLEKTMFKKSIIDPEYKSALTALDMQKPPPTIEQCKTRYQGRRGQDRGSQKRQCNLQCQNDLPRSAMAPSL